MKYDLLVLDSLFLMEEPRNPRYPLLQAFENGSWSEHPSATFEIDSLKFPGLTPGVIQGTYIVLSRIKHSKQKRGLLQIRTVFSALIFPNNKTLILLDNRRHEKSWGWRHLDLGRYRDLLVG